MEKCIWPAEIDKIKNIINSCITIEQILCVSKWLEDFYKRKYNIDRNSEGFKEFTIIDKPTEEYVTAQTFYIFCSLLVNRKDIILTKIKMSKLLSIQNKIYQLEDYLDDCGITADMSDDEIDYLIK